MYPAPATSATTSETTILVGVFIGISFNPKERVVASNAATKQPARSISSRFHQTRKSHISWLHSPGYNWQNHPGNLSKLHIDTSRISAKQISATETN